MTMNPKTFALLGAAILVCFVVGVLLYNGESAAAAGTATGAVVTAALGAATGRGEDGTKVSTASAVAADGAEDALEAANRILDNAVTASAAMAKNEEESKTSDLDKLVSEWHESPSDG